MEYPDRTIERLCSYRRALMRRSEAGADRVFSHDLAADLHLTAAQVRRDLMTIGVTGSPAKGYEIAALLERIGEILDPPLGDGAVLVGVGHLGRALLSYFAGRRAPLSIVAAFDRDPERSGVVLHGCRVHPIDELPNVVGRLNVSVGIIAVPTESAQGVANMLAANGIRGLVNFAAVHLHAPAHVHVENVDITVSMEKTAYFARDHSEQREAN
jgi:redox-sensing transcriptional repressor